MEAIILCGGKGTRLKSITGDLPKCMVEVNGKPFLERQLIWLRRSGVTDIILAVGEGSEHIERYFGNGGKFGVNLTYSKEYEPLGTGGAVKYASRLLEGEDFLIVNGDVIINGYLTDFINDYYRRKKVALMYCPIMKAGVKRFGRVELDKTFKVTKFTEKTGRGSKYINSGIICTNKKMLRYFDKGVKACSLEEEIYPRMVLLDDLWGYISGASFIDIGIPEDYKKYCEYVELVEGGKR